jgi:hypothetical protein
MISAKANRSHGNKLTFVLSCRLAAGMSNASATIQSKIALQDVNETSNSSNADFPPTAHDLD